MFRPKRPARRRNPFRGPKPEDIPAPRNLGFEEMLCEAIRKEVLVKLRYEDDLEDRLFEPTAVYPSTKNKINVTGTQITNPDKPEDDLEPHVFEIGKIFSMSLTDTPFKVRIPIDRFDKRYRNGIMCAFE